MQLRSRVVVVLAALALSVPGVALAKTSTLLADGSGVSTQPPVQLGGTPARPATNAAKLAAEARARRRAATTAAAGDLPNTGSDPRLLFLAGVALMLFGVGLRLRTADAELY